MLQGRMDHSCKEFRGTWKFKIFNFIGPDSPLESQISYANQRPDYSRLAGVENSAFS